ncbi:SHOCT domain-containing protein [bacterium]|nr:SHOCT domain-containing protein [bacterium]
MGEHAMGYHFQNLAIWLIAAAIGVMFALYFWRGRKDGNARNGRETPEQIVKKRYAAGEIDRETYERMISDLNA